MLKRRGRNAAVIAGALGVVNFFWPRAPAVHWLTPLGPSLLLGGALATSGALWDFTRGWRIAVLVLGLLTLAIGVAPLLCTFALRRPDDEAIGMLATIVFLFVVPPGLVSIGVGIGFLLGARRTRAAPCAGSG